MRNAFFNPRRPADSPLHLCTCGYENCEEGFCCNFHTREYYLIHYIVEGEGFYETDGNVYPVSKGELFVIYPGEQVKYYSPSPEKTWTFVWLGFSGSHAEQYLASIGISRDNLVQERQGLRFTEAVRECLRYIEQNQPSTSQIMLDAYALKCLASLEPVTEVPAADRSTTHADMAVRFIKDNYMNGINITDVVSYLNIERSYFYRVFTKHIGVSPQQYLVDYRLDRAKELLQEGASVTDTAEAVGIKNIYGFSTMFKKKFGVPPSRLARVVEVSDSVLEVTEVASEEILPQKEQPASVATKPARSLEPWLL